MKELVYVGVTGEEGIPCQHLCSQATDRPDVDRSATWLGKHAAAEPAHAAAEPAHAAAEAAHATQAFGAHIPNT